MLDVSGLGRGLLYVNLMVMMSVLSFFCNICFTPRREKKREKEREELWKRLESLELQSQKEAVGDAK